MLPARIVSFMIVMIHTLDIKYNNIISLLYTTFNTTLEDGPRYFSTAAGITPTTFRIKVTEVTFSDYNEIFLGK